MLRDEQEVGGETVAAQSGFEATPPPATRVSWVAERLRDAILSGQLEAGEKVPVGSLCSSWEVSATPMREALQRLASEGFVEAEAQRGVRVTEMSMSEARELYELRLQLEPVLLRRSLERFEDEDRAAVAEAFGEYERQWASGAPVLYAMHRSHNRFHEATYRRSDSPFLLGIVANLTVHSMRYSGQVYPPAQRLALHAAINDAVQTEDVDGAVVALDRHTRPGLEWVLKHEGKRDEDA
jgi:GntR family transcriptional regulator, carbon starvation induced regulator